MKQAVHPLPLLRTDLLAHLACVLTSRRDRGGDRRAVAGIEGEHVRNLIRIATPRQVEWIAEGRQHSLPASVDTRRRLIEHQVEIHVKDARAMFCALQVAAHPIQVVCDSREHVYGFNTQVSLLPPPWDEFTTRDPLRSAT